MAIELINPVTIIGRDEGEVTTMDPETSKRHAMIEIMSDGSVWIEDLGSTNGTFTEGQAVTNRVQLKNRQEFTCGNSAFMILTNAQ
jgi:pSer/pThr/pTyr-binding forkhead associated (FHA) protein